MHAVQTKGVEYNWEKRGGIPRAFQSQQQMLLLRKAEDDKLRMLGMGEDWCRMPPVSQAVLCSDEWALSRVMRCSWGAVFLRISWDRGSRSGHTRVRSLRRPGLSCNQERKISALNYL